MRLATTALLIATLQVQAQELPERYLARQVLLGFFDRYLKGRIAAFPPAGKQPELHFDWQ